MQILSLLWDFSGLSSMPYNIPSKDMAYMIAHENAHIRRKDHWWKAAGYVLLAISVCSIL